MLFSKQLSTVISDVFLQDAEPPVFYSILALSQLDEGANDSLYTAGTRTSAAEHRGEEV